MVIPATEAPTTHLKAMYTSKWGTKAIATPNKPWRKMEIRMIGRRPILEGKREDTVGIWRSPMEMKKSPVGCNSDCITLSQG